MSASSTPTRRAVTIKALYSHQQLASEAIATGRGILSRNETSFLHRIREQIDITENQRRWLSDINVRLQWELSHERI